MEFYRAATAPPVGHGGAQRAGAGVGLRTLLVAGLLALVAGAALFELVTEEHPSSPPVARREALPPRGLTALPLAAQDVVSAALGADSAAYAVTASSGVLHARNGTQGLHVRFESSQVQILSGNTRVALSLRAAGYGASLHAVGPVAPTASANTVSYERAGLSEWYRNGPVGLEQGFTIPRALSGHAAGPLTLSMALSGGARASLARGGQSVTLSRAGAEALRYRALKVTDARGRALHGWLELRRGSLWLRVDTRGARYPLRIDPLIQGAAVVQQGPKLTAAGESGSARVGYSVALSSDGNTALVGGGGDDGDLGAAWVFTREGSTWTQQGPKLTPSDEVGAGHFGFSVALSGDGNTAVIGGYGDNGGVGAAWVFTREGSSWTQQGPKLTGSEETGGGEETGGSEEAGPGGFGNRVALSGDGNTALIGGYGDNGAVGAAWVFTREGSSWTQQGPKLTANDELGDGHFGCCGVALSADGNTALIGGIEDDTNVGAAWVFTREGSTWTQQGPKLTASDEIGAGHFGFSVALSGDGNTALIGGVDDNGGVGAAWAFTREGSSWTQQGPKLTANEEIGAAQFGSSVALSADGDTALIGAASEGHNKVRVGSASLFKRSESSWTQQGPKFEGGEETGKEDAFGTAVALSADGDTALIGGPFDDSSLGAAWVFVKATPPIAVTGAASAITQTSATVSATVNPEGKAISDCRFEYGASESYGLSQPCSTLPEIGESPVQVSASLEGLNPGTTYHFRIVASSSGGIGFGEDQMFTTAPAVLPEIGRCLKLSKASGKYKGSTCTTKSVGENTGKYEWQPWPVAKTHFSSESGAARVETHSTSVKCLQSTLAGEYTGSQTVTATIVFAGCEASGALGGECQSEGASAGEIRTDALEGQLGVIKAAAKPSLGADLKSASGPDVMSFECGAGEIAVLGSVIAPVSTVDKMSMSFALKFKASKGRQKPEQFEADPKDTLSFVTESAEEQAGLTMTGAIGNEEPLEIKAIV